MRSSRSPAAPRPATRLVAVTGSALAVATLVTISPSVARADFLADVSDVFTRSLAEGSWTMTLGLAFVAGVLTSLTPCVFPMIAITVSVFGARQAKTKLEAAKLSTAFVLGIATLFTPLGVAAGLTGDVFGALLASPYVLVPLALLFLTLAASMFGAFELNLPASLQNRLATVGGAGVAGAFAFGLVSSLIAAPCTGPVVGALLTWIGTSGNVGFGAAAMFAYSMGLGLLTWMVGTFAVSLPKSGRWVEYTKSIFGIVMVVMAVYYVRDLLGIGHLARKTTTWLLTSAGLLLAGLAAGAVHLTFHDAGVLPKLRKAFGIPLAAAGLLGVVGWWVALPEGARIAWLEDYQHARALAQREHKPLIVDFGASWCGACEELDRDTFSDRRVVAAVREFIAVRIDLSPGKDSPEKRAVLRGYSERGLPLVVIHDREGKERHRVKRFVPPEDLLAMLEDAR
jgi:thiol:disulfide interchange protein DsbD